MHPIANRTAQGRKGGLLEKLPSDLVIDPVEQTLREAKERTFKRRNEEEQAAKKRHEEQEKELQKISKIREELKHKQFLHDADGNVVFLEPVEVSKLPSSTAIGVPKLKTDGEAPVSNAPIPALPPAELALAAGKKPIPIPEAPSAAETAEGFKRLAVASAVSTINPRPGVTVTEKGKSTKGPDAKKLVLDANIMSKAEYLQMVYLNKAKAAMEKQE